LPEETEENHDKPVRIIGIPIGIRKKHLQNTSQKLRL